MREELTEERDRLLNDITQLRRDLDDSSLKQNDLERQIREGNEQVVGLQEKITQAKNENMKEAKKRVSGFFVFDCSMSLFCLLL
jgi:small-conductance mechanosensitive channel